MLLKLQLKSCADLYIYSPTYIGGIKIQLRFPFPWNLHDEPFPNPARQKKMIKGVINYLISEK